ncbi:hypothetical protein [Chishuiella sp.]|uniref:hypothetical protein n=1 Tax=Chishuiella sp. TaxID=1969467 RepID=UPI0028A84631|nr:hypothetical protein [Chishuiella sp.]
MRYIYFLLITLLFTNCATNNIKTIKGQWKQSFLSYKSNPTIIFAPKDEPLITISKKKSKPIIEFDFSDGYDNDKTDSVFFNFPNLKFRKINLDQSSNYYDLVYQPICDCFLGEMYSFSGNVLNIKLNRIPKTK